MKKFISIIIILAFGFTSCTKTVDTTTTVPVTPGTGTTTVGPAFIKFYNVMDYGNVNVTLGGTSMGDVALYYSTAYKSIAAGNKNIKVTLGGNTIIDVFADLVGDKYYSCFIYRVGFNWRVSIVTDDLTTPAAGKAGIRVLDFRTQAYFDYVKVKIFSVGLDQIDYVNRNFLDHLSYDTYTTFRPLAAGTYTTNVFNDSGTLANKSGLVLGNGKIYTLVLMTQADLTATEALKFINIDFSTLK